MINFLRNFLEKFFCKHDWKTHTKKEYRWVEAEIVEGTEYKVKPRYQIQSYSETIEVLICKKCGKIHTLNY